MTTRASVYGIVETHGVSAPYADKSSVFVGSHRYEIAFRYAIWTSDDHSRVRLYPVLMSHGGRVVARESPFRLLCCAMKADSKGIALRFASSESADISAALPLFRQAGSTRKHYPCVSQLLAEFYGPFTTLFVSMCGG